jgi:hypothetical protein
MAGVHFVSFASGRLAGSLARIRAEAAALGRFRSIRTLTPRWLGRDYWAVHAGTVRRHRRGYGFWTWKPYVLRRILAEIPAGDALVYCDAGCSLNVEGVPRLDAYADLAAAHPSQVLAFALDQTVGAWTKRAALVAAEAPDETRARPMVSATALVVRASAAGTDLLREWERRMADLRIVDDSPSPGGEHPEFKAHRHDQSVFSLLAHEREVQTIPDETWWHPVWDERREFPIHARRWRHRLPWSQAWMRRRLWPRW